MNIIELFEYSGIYRENLRGFTPEDIEKVKKQFEIERSQNPNLEPDLANNLILAMNEFPNELLFISNNRILYNFFSRKNYSRNRFSSDVILSVNTESIKSFIDKFLSKDLDLFFERCLSENRFDNIDDLLMTKEYLPESAMANLSQKVGDKLNFIANKLSQNPTTIDIQSIEFLKYRSFYVLVSHFRSEEKDKQMRSIYEKVYGMHSNSALRVELMNPMINSLVNYNAVDYQLNTFFKSNKDKLDAATSKAEEASGSSKSSGWTIFVVIVIILRLIMMMVRMGRA